MKISFCSKGLLYNFISFHITRKFLVLLLLVTVVSQDKVYSQTTPLSFTPIPFSDPDIIAPGRGAEQWDNGSQSINYPLEDSSQSSFDVYYRFTWNRLEGPTQGSYNWKYFDGIVRNAINKGQKLSFGIMTCYPDQEVNSGMVSYDNGNSAYPLYLHNLMQAEAVKDWKTTGSGPTTGNGSWVPNWNSIHYLGRLKALHEALYAHIITSSYTATSGPRAGNTIAYKDVIFSIDIRGYGAWGEWHCAGIIDEMTSYPPGTRPTTATLKTIIDHHVNVFTDFPLSIMISTFDAERSPNTENPKEIAAYALGKTNNWGKLGWRRDNWGATDGYIDWYLKDNTEFFGTSGPFNAIITERWKYAPVTGEPLPLGHVPSSGGDCAYDDLESQLREYHATSFGNGNYGNPDLPACAKENIRAAFKAAGYRIIVQGGHISSTIRTGSPFLVLLDWKNTGVAPSYDKWDVVFELKDSSNFTVWSGVSRFTPGPKLTVLPLLPSSVAISITDTFTLPASIPDGNYSMNLIIKDPTKYRDPLPLAITGRNADGSYTLKNIIVTTDTTRPPIPIPTPTPCPLPNATISNTSTCNGQSFDLVLSSAVGVGPFDVMVNGTTYTGIPVGGTITGFNPKSENIWNENPSPVSNEDDAVELGVKFSSSVAGLVKGIRFYSPDNISGIYAGHLWTSDGILLASATFTNVTANGWQEILFGNPVLISADITYVASYHTSDGRYAATTGGLTSTVSNGSSLTTLSNITPGGNGVYKYGEPGFPSNSYNATNYWVDVVFTPATYTFNLMSVTDSNGCNNTGDLQTLSVVSRPCSQTRPGGDNPSEERLITTGTISSSIEDKMPGEDKKNYILAQNYPNPFSHSTTIQYSLPSAAKINLSLFDMNGRLVKILVNGSKEAGTHSLVFNSGTLSNGPYFYKIQAGEFSATKKMIIQ